MRYRILIVDDDTALLKMLKSYLEMKGYEVGTAEDGQKALDRIQKEPDLILLDVNMPRMDGITLCRRIRDAVSCPILFLTAKVEEQDRINGLLSGGDDYILKPFSLKELEARIIAHLKREERRTKRSKIKFADHLTIDYVGKMLQYDGDEIETTKSEFAIIEFLSMNAGQVFDKERIYERVFGYEAEGDSRSITELVRRIRKKLSVYTDQEYIETVWGNGYKWKK